MSVLRSTSTSGPAERGESSGWKHLDFFFACLPVRGPDYHASQGVIRPHPCAAPSTPTGLWGRFISMRLHRLPPRCLLVPAEPRNVCSSRRIPQPRAGVTPSLLLFVSLSSALFPGKDSDVEGKPWRVRWDLLSALFSLHDFICSKYVEKPRKEEKTLSKTVSTFWTKKEIEVVFSVSNSEICCCLSVLFGLCVAVFCQHEILSPLEDFRGGRATSPRLQRRH